MALEVVKEITSIESQGDKLINDPKISAREEEKKANNEAQKIIAETKNKAEKYYNDKITAYEKQANDLIKPIMEESEGTIKKINNLPEKIINKAVNMVIERIVVSHGNS